MDQRLVSLITIYSVFYVIYASPLATTKGPESESRLSQVIGNLTDKISGISQTVRRMQDIAHSSEDASVSLSENELESTEVPKTNVTYEELIDRVEEARKKVKEIQTKLQSTNAHLDELIKKYSTPIANKTVTV